MGVTLQNHSPGPLTLSKGKIYLILSLVITWWFASLLPNYEPAIKSAVSTRLREARKNIPSIHVEWHRDADPRANFDGTKIALLIEPRYLPHLVPLILHMIYVVPPDWRFVFIGSEKSTKAVGRSFAIQHQQVIGKLDLMTLPEPWEIKTKEMVYRLMTDIRFYDEFLPGVEWILKYEYDSILCANSGTSLNDWLEWSWTGAPKTPDDRFAGNGGLSLRKVSAIRRVLKFQERFNDTSAEDEWFGHRLWVLPGEKVASGINGGALTVEEVYFDNAMGYHIQDGGNSLNSDVWGKKEQRKKILDYCPEVSLIMDMKLERERCPEDRGDGALNSEMVQEKQLEMEKKIEEEKARPRGPKAKTNTESQGQDQHAGPEVPATDRKDASQEPSSESNQETPQAASPPGQQATLNPVPAADKVVGQDEVS